MSTLIFMTLLGVLYMLTKLNRRMERLESAQDLLLTKLSEPTPASAPADTETYAPTLEAASPGAAPPEAATWPPAPVEPDTAPTAAADEPPYVPLPQFDEWVAPPSATAAEPEPEPAYAEAVERQPAFDFEGFVGEHLSKVGIAILTLGIGIFVKYAIDNEWIGTVGRVLIGLLAGGVLAGTAHYLRRQYTAFSSVLVGGALAVFYFTIGLAFHEYHLFGQAAAFGLMVGITGLGVAFAYGYNRIELAVIALLGGFATPLMVSTGQGNYAVLFTYVLILNGGMLALSYLRKWRLVYLVAFVCTLLLYGGWLGGKYQASQAAGGLAFATAFYAMMVAATVAFNLRMRVLFYGEDFLQLLAANLAFLSAGLYILAGVDDGLYRGLFTAVLALANLGLAQGLRRRAGVDRNFVYLLLGLAVSLATLAGPVQLKGNQITLFWAAEAAIVWALFGRARLPLLYYAGWALQALAVFSWGLDLLQGYTDLSGRTEPQPVLLNAPFLAGLVLAAALAACYRLMGRWAQSPSFGGLAEAAQQGMVLTIALAVAYLTGACELGYQLSTSADQPLAYGLFNTGLMAYTGLWLAGLGWASRRRAFRADETLGWALALYMLLVVLLGSGSIYTVANSWVAGQAPGIWIWLPPVSLLALQLSTLTWLYGWALRHARWQTFALWTICLGGAVWVAVATDLAFLWIGRPADTAAYEGLQALSRRAAYPVVLGLLSLGYVWWGLQVKLRLLRLLGLGLFGLVLAKLFFVDVWAMGPGGRIAAFVSLGVLLLVVSFLYQRIKRLVAHDEPTAENHVAV